jgi:hypothetical protein
VLWRETRCLRLCRRMIGIAPREISPVVEALDRDSDAADGLVDGQNHGSCDFRGGRVVRIGARCCSSKSRKPRAGLVQRSRGFGTLVEDCEAPD